ncbi:MAG: hypothetical protein NTZ85_01610, partial [Bacteroidia bacterium]|nr:hypothetical protein [Bacteroidia bacterium]
MAEKELKINLTAQVDQAMNGIKEVQDSANGLGQTVTAAVNQGSKAWIDYAKTSQAVIDVEAKRAQVERNLAQNMTDLTNIQNNYIRSLNEYKTKLNDLNKTGQRGTQEYVAQKQAIQELRTQRNADTKAVRDQIKVNQKLSADYESQMGLVGRLRARINELKTARDKSNSTSDIKRINQEIGQTDKQLNKLTSTNRGFFSSFKSGQSITSRFFSQLSGMLVTTMGVYGVM